MGSDPTPASEIIRVLPNHSPARPQNHHPARITDISRGWTAGSPSSASTLALQRPNLKSLLPALRLLGAQGRKTVRHNRHRLLETHCRHWRCGLGRSQSTHSGLSARQIQRPLADSTPQQRGIVAWRYAKCFLVFTAELRCTDIPAGVGDFSNVGLA